MQRNLINSLLSHIKETLNDVFSSKCTWWCVLATRNDWEFAIMSRVSWDISPHKSPDLSWQHQIMPTFQKRLHPWLLAKNDFLSRTIASSNMENSIQEVLFWKCKPLLFKNWLGGGVNMREKEALDTKWSLFSLITYLVTFEGGWLSRENKEPVNEARR